MVTPVFLPGELHGQKSLVGYSPWGHTEWTRLSDFHSTAIYGMFVAQLVKSPPAVRETWVQSLGWEDLLEKGMATHTNSMDREAWWVTVQGVAKSQTQLST